jgi:hypothetical protein
MAWQAEHQLLEAAGFGIARGLSEPELERAEALVGARLPPDLREFLAQGLPIGEGLPNWREPESKALRDQLDWPFEGIAFDIEHSAFWWDAWGARPPQLADAILVARAQVALAPRLIPISGHRYLPAEPGLAGNPVFSVYQTDIIYYGSDLGTYLRCEFDLLPYADAVIREPRSIAFWSELVAANNA